MAARSQDDLPANRARMDTVGRIKRDVVVDGDRFWTLFDAGAVNTYVTEEVASRCPSLPSPRIEGVRLGGQTHQPQRLCFFACLVEGLQMHGRPSHPGDRKRRRRSPIQILLEALTMREWRIIPVPQEERLELTNYPHPFVEFLAEGQSS